MNKSFCTLNILKFSILLLFLLAFTSVVYYQWTGLKVDFYHESVYPLFYAENILDAYLPYSSSFMGREISPFSWPLVGAFFLFLFGKITFTVHSLMVTTFDLFVIFVVYYFSKSVNFSKVTLLFFLYLMFIVFTSSPSHYNWLDQVWVWPMNSYGVYDMFSLLALGMFISLYKISDKSFNNKTYLKLLILSIVYYFIVGLDGIRGFLTMLMPIFGMAVFIYANTHDKSIKQNIIKISFPLIISSILALSIILFLTKGVPQPWQTAHQLFTIDSFEAFNERIIRFFYSWLSLFNAIPPKGTYFASFYGIKYITISMFSLMLLVLPFIRFFQTKVEKNLFEQILIYKFFIVLLLISVANIYGTASGVERYMIPLAYSAIFVLVFSIDRYIKEQSYLKYLIVLFLTIPTFLVSINTLTKHGVNDYKNTDKYKLGQFLIENNLKYGYSGPYQDNTLVINYMTDSKVKIYPIDISPNLEIHGHADKQWYKENLKESFILIQQSHYINSKELQELSKFRTKQLHFEGGWIIDVYPFDLANYLNTIQIKTTLSDSLNSHDIKDEPKVTIKDIKDSSFKEGALFNNDMNLGKEYTYYGSYLNGGDDYKGSITFDMNKDSGFYYKTGPKSEKQVLYIIYNSMIIKEFHLPATNEKWGYISLTNISNDVTIKIEDSSSSWGEWSAIAVKEKE